MKFSFRVTLITSQILRSHTDPAATIQVSLVREIFTKKVLPGSQEQGLQCKITQFLTPGTSSILLCFTNLGPYTSSLPGTLPRKAFWIWAPLWTDMAYVIRWSTINANLTFHIGHCSSQAGDPELWNTEMLSMCK